MLEAATRDAERVWPVFVADPALLEKHAGAPARVAWFGANLRALDKRLREAGSGLTILRGRPEEVLREFAIRIGADTIFAAWTRTRCPPPAMERWRSRLTCDSSTISG